MLDTGPAGTAASSNRRSHVSADAVLSRRASTSRNASWFRMRTSLVAKRGSRPGHDVRQLHDPDPGERPGDGPVRGIVTVDVTLFPREPWGALFHEGRRPLPVVPRPERLVRFGPFLFAQRPRIGHAPHELLVPVVHQGCPGGDPARNRPPPPPPPPPPRPARPCSRSPSRGRGERPPSRPSGGSRGRPPPRTRPAAAPSPRTPWWPPDG